MMELADDVAIHQYGQIIEYIIILSGMEDDVPILGAVVALLNAMGYGCF